jgi:type IV fimbrial biogenesis protein FimT
MDVWTDRSRHGRGGLTLIELLIVITMIGILTTIAVPRVSAIRTRMQVDAAAQQVLGDLRRARSEALKRNTSIRMWKTSASLYSIDSIGSRGLPNSVVFSAGSDSVRFSSFGPPVTGAASFTVSLNGRTKQVVLSAAGLMTVQ